MKKLKNDPQYLNSVILTPSMHVETQACLCSIHTMWYEHRLYCIERPVFVFR